MSTFVLLMDWIHAKASHLCADANRRMWQWNLAKLEKCGAGSEDLLKVFPGMTCYVLVCFRSMIELFRHPLDGVVIECVCFCFCFDFGLSWQVHILCSRGAMACHIVGCHMCPV